MGVIRPEKRWRDQLDMYSNYKIDDPERQSIDNYRKVPQTRRRQPLLYSNPNAPAGGIATPPGRNSFGFGIKRGSKLKRTPRLSRLAS